MRHRPQTCATISAAARSPERTAANAPLLDRLVAGERGEVVLLVEA
jgi:hypothetical protein